MTPTVAGPGRDPDEEPRSVTAKGAGNAQMGVLGQGQQWNLFGGADNHDVVVVIEYEHDVVELQIDADKRLSVEVTNHTGNKKQLSLRANGLPQGIATLDPVKVVVGPDETRWVTLTLRCTATTPMAGSRSLLVVAVDLDSGIQWPSNARMLAIPSKPEVRLTLSGPEGVALAGAYPARIQVSNLGNTMLEGRVRYYRQGSKGILAPEMSFSRSQGDAVGFHSTSGESTEIDLNLTFPTQGWRRRHWEMSFQMTVDHDDVSDSYHRFRVTQQGRLAELWLAVLQNNAVRAGVLRRSTPIVLVVVAVFVLVTVLLPGERNDADRRASPPAAEVPVAKRTTPDIPYDPLPCTPGRWVVYLSTMVGPRSDDEARFVLAHETDRLRSVLKNETKRFEYIVPGSRYTVHASTMDDVCPDTYVHVESADRRFVWLEPFLKSEAEAKQVCVDIGKPLDYDCLPWPAG